MGSGGPEHSVGSAGQGIQKNSGGGGSEAVVPAPRGGLPGTWVADNVAGTYGWPPHIGFLVDAVCEPTWAEEMAVEWREYAPAPPVRIDIGPAKRPRVGRAPPVPDLPLPSDVVDDGLALPESADLDLPEEVLDPVAPAAAAAPGGIAAPVVPAPPGNSAPPPVSRRPAAAPALRPVPKAMGMSLGCSKCRRSSGGCIQCRPVAWRRARAAREASRAAA